MKIPSEFEIKQLLHRADYDPAKAHEYYVRNRKLKGRKPGHADVMTRTPAQGVRPGKTRVQIAKDVKAKQRKELAAAVSNLEDRLKKLEALIRERMRDESSEDRKGKAKKERAAKEKDKPKSAAEKAKNARENEKYRDKNQQKLKADRKKDSSSGGKSKKGSKSKKQSVTELKSLATRVRGQLAVAKQKLAAL